MRRALGIVLVVFVAGCPSIDPTQPKKYQCADPQSSALECPGGWRCTLDGFCADPDAGQELTCDFDQDCTGGWTCALTGKCVNPAVGRPLPCDLDFRCPGGWRCGAIGQCFDPDAGAALPCQTEQDCPNDWHCGAGPICYELAKATAVVCRPDAGPDCAPGWRCGLEARCHAEDAGAPLLCQADSDCEHAWRCAAGGRCADATLDALRSTQMSGTPVVTAVPTFVPDDVRAVSISTALFENVGPLAAFAGDGGLTVVAFSTGAQFDAGAGRPGVPGFVAQTAAPGVQALSAQAVPLVWAAAGDQLTGYVFSRPGVLTSTYERSPGFAIEQFRFVDGTTLAAFGRRNVVTLSDTGTVSPVYSVPTGSTAFITDVAVLTARIRRADAGVGRESTDFVILTSEGALASPWNGSDVTGEWVPVTFGRTGLLTFIAPTGSSPEGLAKGVVKDLNGLGSVATLAGGPVPGVGAWLVPPSVPDVAITVTDAVATPYGCAPVGLSAGRQLRSWWAMRCATDAGTVFEFSASLSQVATIDMVLPDGYVIGDDNAEVIVHAGRGAALLGSTLTGLPLVPLGSSERVEVLLGTASAPKVVTAQGLADPVQCAQGLLDYCQPRVARGLCTTGNTPWLWCRDQSFGPPLYRVTGQPDMQLVDIHQLGLPAPFVIFRTDPSNASIDVYSTSIVATSAIDFGDVGATATAKTPDGGLQMFVGAADHLYWGDLSRPDSPSPQGLANPSAFHFAVVPQPGATITSVTALEGGSHFAEGYLVASGRVHHFVADNAVVWVSELESISTAEAVAVWADGHRGRVAFRDGSVFGLPSRVPLSVPVSTGASTVIALESTCGQTFALTTGGLFELRTSAAPLATWARIELGLPDSALLQGQLIAEEAGLYLALPGKNARRLTGFSCAQ